MRRGRVPIQSHGGEKNVARLPRRDLRDRGTFERSKTQPAVSGRAHARIGFRQWLNIDQRALALLTDLLKGPEIHFDRWAHRGRHVQAFPITPLRATGLVAIDRFLQRLEIL